MTKSCGITSPASPDLEIVPVNSVNSLPARLSVQKSGAASFLWYHLVAQVYIKLKAVKLAFYYEMFLHREKTMTVSIVAGLL